MEKNLDFLKSEKKSHHVLVGVQFLSALNIYLGGNMETLKNAMSEFY